MLVLLLWLFTIHAVAQDVRVDLPDTIDSAGYYLFYLHGGVVTVKGDNAISDAVPQFGPYQYSRILDTLGAHGFNVVSERRLPDIADSVYVIKISHQINALLMRKVPVTNMMLVGASAGSDIVLHIAGRLNLPEMKYVIMGGCWPDVYKYYAQLSIRGRFLSIIESSDPHGTCARIFDDRRTVKDFHEIVLNTGLNHGFIYRPYAAWIDPVVEWFQTYASGYRARKAMAVDGH